jgi:hypothetical protein
MMGPIPEPDRAGLRRFGLVTGGLLAGLFGLAFPLLAGRHIPVWPWAVGGVLAAWALAAPASLRPVYRGWMRVGGAVGWVNTRILLTLVFFVVVTPMGLAMRLLGRRPLSGHAPAPADAAETWRVPSEAPPRERMERPY